MSEAKDRKAIDNGGKKRSESASEFFAVGTPLQPLRASYIRRPADELFFEALLAGRYAHVIAPDQSGKTSLISATAARLENNGVSVAVLDLEQLGLRDGGTEAGRFYYSVAYRILRQLRIRFELQTWWQDKSLFSNRQRLHEFFSEVVLGQTSRPVVIMIDEVQCVEHLPFTDQLLTSIRSAHDARTTDPEFTRLSFALCGECDPSSLVTIPEQSPFQVTQSVPLRDFTRDEINLFATELNLPAEQAGEALDRIYYWTSGQPYMTQKLSRALARDDAGDDINGAVDAIVSQQFTHRASLGNEPLLNHVQNRVVDDPSREQLLNLYGRIRKGVEVPTDLGSPLQRKLVAVGLLTIDEKGDLGVRNRIYGEVFSARWANENLPIHWRAPLLALLVVAAFLLIPFWYTQWLPKPYVAVLTSPTTELDVAETAWQNFRSFPGHTDVADTLYRLYIQEQARTADSVERIDAVVQRAAAISESGALGDRLLAAFHDRAVARNLRAEARDEALLASIEALIEPSPERRRRAAALIGDDYPGLIATLGEATPGEQVFNAEALAINYIDGSTVNQWSLVDTELKAGESFSITALEVTPLVRRVFVDQEGTVARASLRLNLSHARHADLRIKIIAPSGRTIEIETGRDRSSVVDDIRIDRAQLAPLEGEALMGTWSLSIRDEGTGIAGQLVGWNLTLNSQGLVEDFQRGLDIPDPVQVDASNVWFSEDGRYAVARATQSDSARVWDLTFGKPIRAIAVTQGETIIGLDNGARRLLTATIDTVNIWDTATGDRLATLPIEGAGIAGSLTADRRSLFLNYPGDTETRFALWSLETLEQTAELSVAGSPALVSLDAGGDWLAVADFDRSVRVWDFKTGELTAQLNLGAQPSSIHLAAGGTALGAVYGRSGVSLWRLEETSQPLFEFLEQGDWQLAFAPSGTRVALGRPATGYSLFDVSSGRPVGSVFGLGAAPGSLLAFSVDETVVLTGASPRGVRFWRAPAPGAGIESPSTPLAYWQPQPGTVVTATPDARKILVGDRGGHLNIVPRSADPAQLARAAANELSFLGHSSPIRRIAVDRSGLWAATAAEDGSLRAWSLTDGVPKSWTFERQGLPLVELGFSPDARLIAAADRDRVLLIDRATGERLAEFAHAGGISSLVFASSDTLYLGSTDGSLFGLSIVPGPEIEGRKIWDASAAITNMAVGPRGDSLIVVDADGLARVLSITESSQARLTLELPERVLEVAVAPVGAEVLFRTERWVHQAIAGVEGLAWKDATLVAPVNQPAQIVFDTTLGRVYEPMIIASGGNRLVLRPLRASADEAGLFGSREELLSDWRRRLGVLAPAAEAETIDAPVSGVGGR